MSSYSFRGPKFALIATANLSLAEASDLPHTHDLRLINQVVVNTNGNQNVPMNPGSSTALPLFGHFCCRLAVQPDSFEVATVAGELAGFEVKSLNGHLELEGGYAKLQAFRMNVWESEKAYSNNLEIKRSIAIGRDTKLKHRGNNDLDIINMEDGTLVEYVIKTNSVSEQTKWFAATKNMIKEHQQWGHVVLNGPMTLASPESKGYFLRSHRQRSLYDQVPIMSELISPPFHDDTEINFSFLSYLADAQESNGDLPSLTNKHDSSRPSVHEIFAIPNSPTEFRHRTYSSSRSSSHSMLSNGSSVGSISSRKSHWPFTGK